VTSALSNSVLVAADLGRQRIARACARGARWNIVSATTERRGDIELSYDLGDLADTGAATAITLFHPGKNQAVLVVAAADLAAAEARLRPQLGTSLCVVRSRWTKDQLDGVRDHLGQRWQQWNLLRLGPRHAEDGQPHIAARLVRVLPEIAVWAAALPPGIVAFEPWLTPVR
jgi:hypothetical protein